MSEEEIKKLKEISSALHRMNAKVKLLGLLERAKFEYEQNNLVDCEKNCREILKSEPKNSIALRGLGCVFQSKGDNKNAILEAGKAFESTMKTICDKQGYTYDKAKDTAQKLITILENNGF